MKKILFLFSLFVLVFLSIYSDDSEISSEVIDGESVMITTNKNPSFKKINTSKTIKQLPKPKNESSKTTTELDSHNESHRLFEFNIETAFESTEYYDEFLKAYKNNDHDKVIAYGLNLLKIPDSYSSQFWYGNLCHAVHIILGKTYLSSGDLQKAKEHLINSVKNKCIENSIGREYSPQLSSFGPDRSLAYTLYKSGERQVVLDFFELARAFWLSGVDDGTIDNAVSNIQVLDLTYEQEDDETFPFPPVKYAIDYEKAPMSKATDY